MFQYLQVCYLETVPECVIYKGWYCQTNKIFRKKYCALTRYIEIEARKK